MKFSFVRVSDALRGGARAAAMTVVAVAMTASAAENTFITGPIQEVIVNGGADTVNGGLSCIAMAGLPEQCRGFVAIPNGNKSLLSAALMSRAKGGDSRVYMQFDTTQNHHCPGIAFTSCQAISISLK
ncbi:hypothetical protein ACFJIX_12395 [Roseateles sp. UC29_93]|uniref:hypothetical protein n=1 Tax=Roseateles sp. UC29_93 TaxID=3350177 RepID=UPI00366E9CB2